MTIGIIVVVFTYYCLSVQKKANYKKNVRISLKDHHMHIYVQITVFSVHSAKLRDVGFRQLIPIKRRLYVSSIIKTAYTNCIIANQ